MADDPQAQAVESLDQVYRTVFVDEGSPPRELPSREGKSYALTASMFRAKRDKIVKTIASLANHGADIAYIIFRGDKVEDDPVDPALVDDAIRSVIYPRITVEIVRSSIDGRVVDFVKVPATKNRPHLMKNTSDELILPVRGAANNSTAGRHELDAMYDERTLDLIRRALNVKVDRDPREATEDYLNEIDWGGVSESVDPEFVFAVVPAPIGGTPLKTFIDSRELHSVLFNAWTETITKENETDWFTLNGDFVTGYHDDYIEAYQPARDNHRIGTIRIFDTGVVVTRIWILEPVIDGSKMFSFNHFKTALRLSLIYTSRVYALAGLPGTDLEIRCSLIRTGDLDLWITPSHPRRVLQNRDVGRRLEIPKRSIRAHSNELAAKAAAISEDVARALRGHYGDDNA